MTGHSLVSASNGSLFACAASRLLFYSSSNWSISFCNSAFC
jgi:hypothetical protein